MEIYKNLSVEVPGTNTHYFNLDEFDNVYDGNALFYGFSFLENGVNPTLLNRNKRNVYFNVTMPTEFCSNQNLYADDIFDEIWTICPYSVNWLNQIKNNNKYRTIFYPFNKKDIPQNSIKKFDAIYHGGIHGEKYIKMLEKISKFNYKYLTQLHGINQQTQQMLSYATDTNLTNNEKLKIISECKISICFNTFEVRNNQDFNNIKSRPFWNTNEAFKHIDDLRIIPQFKSRCNEAAFCKTLNLVQRDPWNLIEKYYEKDEFVYFDTVDELPEIISYILNNWEKYEIVIEKAFVKSLNYTTENLYKQIKNNIQIYDL